MIRTNNLKQRVGKYRMERLKTTLYNIIGHKNYVTILSGVENFNPRHIYNLILSKVGYGSTINKWEA